MKGEPPWIIAGWFLVVKKNQPNKIEHFFFVRNFVNFFNLNWTETNFYSPDLWPGSAITSTYETGKIPFRLPIRPSYQFSSTLLVITTSSPEEENNYCSRIFNSRSFLIFGVNARNGMIRIHISWREINYIFVHTK